MLAALKDADGSVTAEELAAMFAKSTGKEPLTPGPSDHSASTRERSMPSARGEGRKRTGGATGSRVSAARVEAIAELLEALATLGQARRLRGGKYTS